MKIKQACKCLGINENQINTLSDKQIRHKYHILQFVLKNKYQSKKWTIALY